MARKYHVLLVREDDQWSQQFGDYDKDTVIAESHDYRDQGHKAKNLKVLAVDGDTQADIDAAVSRFTGVNVIARFPGIKRVALNVAYDNGMINRDCPEWKWLRSLDPILGASGVDEQDLLILDRWCAELTDEDAETLAAGEETEMQAVAARCPKPDLCGLFNDIFEGVHA